MGYLSLRNVIVIESLASVHQCQIKSWRQRFG